MASATLTYVTGVNAATNYVRVGHNSSAVNNDAVWSFSLAASTGVAKWTGVKFTLKWNNTSAGTGWSGSYTYVFAVSSSGSAGRTAQSGSVLGRTTVSLSGSSGTATVTITGLSLTPGTTYYLRANQNGSTYSTMKAFQKASNTCESTANTWTTGTIYYNAGTAWLPQSGQVGGTANGSSYCKSLISALGHTHFASANGSSALTETYNYNSTAFNAYNSTTLFNPPAGYRHSPEATQLFVYDYTKGTWLNHTGASAASINFRNYSLNWGDTIVMFTNWLINTLTVNYHANGGNFDTQSGTTRYRVSSNLVQQSTNSGSSWTTLSTTGNINSNVDCHNVTTSGYGGGLKKAGYHVNAGAEFNTKADGTGVNVNQDNGSTNVPSVYRINGNANLTDNKTITLYVNWKPNTYTVVFNANGGSGTMANESFTYGSAKALTSNSFTRTGYTFAGWNTNSSGTGTNYSNGQSVSNLTTTNGGTVYLYAKWTPISYTVKFDANGGSGTMADESFTYDTSKALTTNEFTRPGYEFVEWNTQSDGSGTSYSDGQSVSNLTTASGGIVNLYAIWERSTICNVWKNNQWNLVPANVYKNSAWHEAPLKIRKSNDWKG